jgi:NurA-like 5'-3' nuclease
MNLDVQNIKSFRTLLVFINKQVIELIANETKWDIYDAKQNFYRSKTYELLEEEETKIWRLSPLSILDIYLHELKMGNPSNSAYLSGGLYV